jgi:hypothetical protein
MQENLVRYFAWLQASSFGAANQAKKINNHAGNYEGTSDQQKGHKSQRMHHEERTELNDEAGANQDAGPTYTVFYACHPLMPVVGGRHLLPEGCVLEGRHIVDNIVAFARRARKLIRLDLLQLAGSAAMRTLLLKLAAA